MTQFELAKKTLNNIGWHTLKCNLYASEGGACGGGWDGDGEMDLSPDQIRYLIKEKMDNDELFEGIQTKAVDVDDTLEEMAEEGSWPDGGIRATVNDVIPDELADLSEDLNKLFEKKDDEHDEKEEDNDVTIESVREKLRAVRDGEYTFHFNVTDAYDSYYFGEDAEEKITLTANEALGLLYGVYGLDEVFEGLCDKALDEDFINDKAEDMEVADGYDNFSYRGECESLDVFIDSWVYILENILSGNITEETLDSWMGYFDEPENYDIDIRDWYECMYEEDEEE